MARSWNNLRSKRYELGNDDEQHLDNSSQQHKPQRLITWQIHSTHTATQVSEPHITSTATTTSWPAARLKVSARTIRAGWAREQRRLVLQGRTKEHDGNHLQGALLLLAQAALWASVLHVQLPFLAMRAHYLAMSIYCCGCLRVYMNRGLYKFCCCLCRVFNCCWSFTDKEFPPDESSLGSVGGDSADKKAAGIQPRRRDRFRAPSVGDCENSIASERAAASGVLFAYLSCVLEGAALETEVAGSLASGLGEWVLESNQPGQAALSYTLRPSSSAKVSLASKWIRNLRKVMAVRLHQLARAA
ncbi:unnamed protein product [Polarella glacialis]|uniref:Uncharacterized protein n=1 Tax=Polarella glacialis TaxID=89957 RepID=A0A813DJE8_POLGL|nr:unnamed protein product [Polarella glacialis]